MTLLTLNNLRIGKLALIAAALAIALLAALGAPGITEAAGGAQAGAIADSCDGAYWPFLLGGLFGWLMDLIFGLC